MIEDAIQTRLSAVAALTNIVDTRIYYGQLPQNPTYPCVSYHLISEKPEHAMGADTGVVRARVQVDSWGRDSENSPGIDQARNTDAAVVTALSRFRGTLSPASGDVVVQDIMRLTAREDYEDKTRVWHRTRDFEVIYQE